MIEILEEVYQKGYRHAKMYEQRNRKKCCDIEPTIELIGMQYDFGSVRFWHTPIYSIGVRAFWLLFSGEDRVCDPYDGAGPVEWISFSRFIRGDGLQGLEVTTNRGVQYYIEGNNKINFNIGENYDK